MHGGKTAQEHRKEAESSTSKPSKESSGEDRLGEVLILDFQPPSRQEDTFLLFKLPRL